MADLISREAAKEEILSWAVRITSPNNLSTADTMYVLDTLPAVDAVEVVRCKDCEQMIEKGWCSLHGAPMTRNDFCSYGKRRGRR